MAKGKGTRKVSMSAEEKTATEALESFNKRYEGKTLTEAQKDEKKRLTATLGKLKFLRIANKRLPRAVKALDGLANLGGNAYVKSEAQVTAIVKRLQQSVDNVKAKLMGSKPQAETFTIPGFEDGGEKK